MRLLLVEDGVALAAALIGQLERHGFTADHAATGEDAEHLLATNQYAALILDLGLPDGDGLGVLRRLRTGGLQLPVIVLTARAEVASRVAGLDAGADDYVTKPFATDELVARLRAVLRRNDGFHRREVVCGNLTFDTEACSLRVDGRAIPLSPREAGLLELLIRRLGMVVTRQLAEDQLFGATDSLGSNAIEVYVHRLRHKLQAAGATIEIITVRGVGYLLQIAA